LLCRNNGIKPRRSSATDTRRLLSVGGGWAEPGFPEFHFEMTARADLDSTLDGAFKSSLIYLH
jgi:hypothetical protein